MPRSAAWGKAALAALTTAAVTYVAACAFIAAPQPTFVPTQPGRTTIALDEERPQSLVDTYVTPTAVGWLDGHDEAVWTNDETPHPLASITKLVTVLVGQERDPLRAGEPGPSHTWTERDRAFQTELLEEDGIAFPLPVGTEVTRLEMLQLALVPSANDFATAYAHSLFGDDASFAAAVDTWATAHGLDSLKVVEPSGMDDGNVANAADVVRLARLALADPVIAELVRTERVPLPAANVEGSAGGDAESGTVENTNPLLGTKPGVVGVKTGHTEAAGFSLAAAARSTVAGRELTAIAVVMSRESEEQRAADAAVLLDSLATLPGERALATAGDTLGELRSVTGERKRITVAESRTAVLVPGELVTTVFDPGGPALVVSGLSGAYDVPVRGAEALPEPTLWWRLTHPRELFFER